MIIIAGWLEVIREARDRYVADCIEVVTQARASVGCLDFSITADTVDAERIRIFERWESEADLLAFRGAGPGDDQSAQIIGASVSRYEISAVGPP